MASSWVFFDVGDVLFNENAQHTVYFHTLLLAMRRNGVQVEWDDYSKKIIDCVRVKPATAIVDAARLFVPDDEVWNRIYHDGRAIYDATRKPRPYGTLLDGITPVLQALRERFHLGIIANQHAEVLEAIEEYGIGPLFEVKIIDTLVGVSKPDAAIFRLALAQAGCDSSEAIMVGDRPDNDITPAKAMGLRTVRFQRGILYNHYEPDEDKTAEHADVVVTDVSGLQEAIERAAI